MPIINKSKLSIENESKNFEEGKNVPELYPVKTFQVVESKKIHPIVYSNSSPLHGIDNSLQNANLINQNLKMLLLNNVPVNRGSNVFIKSQSNNFRIPSERNDNYYANISPIKTKHFINNAYNSPHFPFKPSMSSTGSETFKFDPIPVEKATFPLENKFTNDDFYSVNFLQKSHRLRGRQNKLSKNYKNNIYDSVMKYYYGG